MSRVKTYITIEGTDVSSYIYSWNNTETFGDEIPDLELSFKNSLLSVLDIENGDEVIVYRGYTTGQEEKIFRGRVDTIQKQAPLITLRCKNLLIDLVHKSVNVSFDENIDPEAGVGSAIAQTLIEDYAGLSTNGGATVVSTGTTTTLPKFVCRKTDIFERLRTIADIYDYQFYYNYDDDYVYFEPTGYQTNTNNLIVGTNVTNIPKWEWDNTQLVNEIRIEGAETYVETTESGQIGVTTGYTTSSVQLLNSPFSTKVYCDAADPPTTLRIGGIYGASSSYDYYLDTEEYQVKWSPTYTPGGSDYVIVQYTYPTPIPIIRKRQSSIDAYGLSSTTKSFSDVKTVDDAINRATIYLDTYAEPFVSTVLYVPSISNTYKVGQMVTVVDNVQAETHTLPITKIVKKYPHQYDEIYVGDKEYSLAEYNRLTLDKIKRLEEEFSKNDDILIQIIDDDPEEVSVEIRDQILQKREYVSGFILGHPRFGILGTSTLGGSFTAITTQKIIQGGMRYKEYCYDEDYHDAGSSTCTFDTVNQEIFFMAGQTWYSNVLFKGTTYQYATLHIDNKTGSAMTYYISADGKSNWQVITLNSKTTLVNSDGTGVYLKFVCTAMLGDATLSLTKDAYGRNTSPVVELYMEE
jgi:hypothetical protein